MTERNQLFAFVAGEVSKQFYGRRDLAKYPFGLTLLENFQVDYRGGIINRSGTEHIADFPNTAHAFFCFKTTTGDISLFFHSQKLYVLRNGKFAMTGATAFGVVSDEASGEIAVSGTYEVDQYVKVVNGPLEAYARIMIISSGKITIGGRFLLSSDYPVSVRKVYTLDTGITNDVLPSVRFYQDFDTVVCTATAMKQLYFTRIADNDWELSEFVNDLPAAPTNVTASASDTGSGSVAIAITAVVDGVESKSSEIFQLDNIINYTTNEGLVDISWDAVPDAEYYNVYSTLLLHSPYTTGTSLGYIGYTAGTAFENANITPDFTKAPPRLAGFFKDENYPSVYCRFQQRGVYAGLKNNPLDVVGSIVADKRIFSTTFTPTAADSYSYTLDAETEKPIKHIIPLRYGLMCFTADNVTQLRGGGESNALTPLSAIAEVQAYTPISDVTPIAINLDLIFLSALNTELNTMIYTEYVNSFKMTNVMALSSHMFSKANKATHMLWAPEPHKLVQFVREDGQRVTLTYEREQDVFGWARHKTDGRYVAACVVREEDESVCYFSVVRKDSADPSIPAERLRLERERPRSDTRADEFFFVDCGKEFSNKVYTTPAKLLSLSEDRKLWRVLGLDAVGLGMDQVVYLNGIKFYVSYLGDSGLTIHLTAAATVPEELIDEGGNIYVPAGGWWTGESRTEVAGLYWLEGRTVSVYADGNCYTDLVVEGGKIILPSPAIYVVVGLPYRARARTLPLGLSSYNVDGDKLNLRGIALRQNETRGLKVGDAFDNLLELPTRQAEFWDNSLESVTELTIVDDFGFLGDFSNEKFICFEQSEPLPATVIGVTFNLDVGA